MHHRCVLVILWVAFHTWRDGYHNASVVSWYQWPSYPGGTCAASGYADISSSISCGAAVAHFKFLLGRSSPTYVSSVSYAPSGCSATLYAWNSYGSAYFNAGDGGGILSSFDGQTLFCTLVPPPSPPTAPAPSLPPSPSPPSSPLSPPPWRSPSQYSSSRNSLDANDQSTDSTGAIVGATVGAAIIIAAMVAAFIFRKRRHLTKQKALLTGQFLGVAMTGPPNPESKGGGHVVLAEASEI